MYDGAGEWLYTVGLPAKSGVSGGILAVVPGRLGLGFFAPPLDPQGNSVRGGRACRDIVRDLDLHPLGEAGPTTRPVRASYTLAEVGSKRERPAAAREALAGHGGRAIVIELQGALTFLAAEAVATTLQAASRTVDAPIATLVVDLRRVERLDGPSIVQLAEVLARVASSGSGVIVSGRHRHAAAIGRLDRAIAGASGGPLTTTDDLDTAIEAAEDALLEGLGHLADSMLSPEDHPILAGLDDADRCAVLDLAAPRAYTPGTLIVRAGDPSDELFLVVGGRLSVTIEVPGSGRRRLTTLGPGMVFGETSVLGHGRRGADVHADGPVACLVLPRHGFDVLAAERPTVALTILRNLLATASATTGRLTREMAVLAG
jgi:glutaminase